MSYTKQEQARLRGMEVVALQERVKKMERHVEMLMEAMGDMKPGFNMTIEEQIEAMRRRS